MKSASENNAYKTPASVLAEIMTACGFTVRLWRGQRVYLDGYGRDISAYLEPYALNAEWPADGVRIDVRSNWQSARYNGLRCKGVKHAILKDLWTAQLISAPPPESWKDVPLVERGDTQTPLRPYVSQSRTSA